MILRIASIVIIVCQALLLTGQVKFYAKSDTKKILRDSYVQVEFVLENGDGANFRPPNFSPLQKVSGPSTSTSMTIVNGRRSNSMTYTYVLSSKSLGKFTIGEASISVNGKVYKTNPIQIEVVKPQKQAGQQQGGDYFVNMIASDSTAHIGQQIILEYLLYTKADVRQYNIMNESAYDGFYRQDLNVPRQYERTIYNGEEYFYKPLKRVALFPQQVGTYEIPDVTVTLGIATGQRRGFFQTVDNKNVRVNGITLKVAELPQPAPSSFSGAVGKYTMTVGSSKKTLTTDDAITINMTVRGDGDAKYVSAPDLSLPDGLELYDPNTTKDESSQIGDRIMHTKSFQYLIVAQKPGRYTILPEFTYMDYDSSDYVTMQGNALNFRVLKGSGVAQQVIEADDQLTLVPISQTTRLRSPDKIFFGSLVYFLVLGLLGAGLAGLYFYRRQLEKSGAFDHLVQRQKKAKLKVITELDKELAAVAQGDTKARIEVMSKKLNAYITQKFAEKDIQFTDEEVIATLQDKHMPDSIIESVQDFQQQCQMSIYAGMNTEKQSAMYDQLVGIITDVDANLRTNG